MAARLEIKHGLVSESDRLSTSSDSLSVTEPSTGSKTRTKGILHLIVASTLLGPRAREATTLVSELIRHEYYYDESAGVPVCLEKAVKSASRRLRNSRQSAGMPPGALSVGLAVVRNSELYLATVGSVDAYLVRSARLLAPERRSAPGLPADDSLRLDVWRGELAPGDVLILASRNLTETIGTDELRNAVLTLHPQSAVEHLHHLFVAAGGAGSDAVIVVEAGDLATRIRGRLVNGNGADAYGDLPPAAPDPMAGAANTLNGALGGARRALFGVVDRAMDAMPVREARPGSLVPLVSRQEAQRRAALAILALLAAVVTLGVIVWSLPRGVEREITTVSAAEAAFIAAQEAAAQAADAAERGDSRAAGLYRDAWRDLRRAEAAGLPAQATAELAAQIRAGLDGQYLSRVGQTRLVVALPEGADPGGAVRGPDGAIYTFDWTTNAVTRVDVENGVTVEIGRAGEASWVNMNAISILSSGGPDVILLDVAGEAWRWRPSNKRGRGTLAPLRIGGDVSWGDDITDVGTFLLPGQSTGGLYNLYVADPSSDQILRYNPTGDGSGFTPPTNYLVTDNPAVATFRKILVDGDIYALTDSAVLKYYGGRLQADFSLETPPDDGDLRPGHDYRLIRGTPGRGVGSLYILDARWGRVLVFDKQTGRYQGQWSTGEGGPSMLDARGLVMVPPKRAKDPVIVYWVSPEGVFETRLAAPKRKAPEA